MSRWPLTGLTVVHASAASSPRKYRAGADGIAARQARFRGGIFDGLSESQRAVLEARGKCGRNQLGRCASWRRRLHRALDQILMARRRSRLPSGCAHRNPKVASGELLTCLISSAMR